MLEERVDQIWEWINGGPSKRYEDSARGMLHRLMQTESTADKLAEALLQVRQERGRQWATWQKLLLAGCAVGTVIAAWYGVLHG